MITINPHINFNGNTEEAFNFYKSVFGGEISNIIRFKDLPGLDQQISENEMNKIMHITLSIGNNLLIGNDVPEFMGRVNENENRSKISISLENKQDADRIFNNLSQGGHIEFPIGESSWGSYFAMFRDRYGIEWVIDCIIKNN